MYHSESSEYQIHACVPGKGSRLFWKLKIEWRKTLSIFIFSDFGDSASTHSHASAWFSLVSLSVISVGSLGENKKVDSCWSAIFLASDTVHVKWGVWKAWFWKSRLVLTFSLPLKICGLKASYSRTKLYCVTLFLTKCKQTSCQAR